MYNRSPVDAQTQIQSMGGSAAVFGSPNSIGCLLSSLSLVFGNFGIASRPKGPRTDDCSHLRGAGKGVWPQAQRPLVGGPKMPTPSSGGLPRTVRINSRPNPETSLDLQGQDQLSTVFRIHFVVLQDRRNSFDYPQVPVARKGRQSSSLA